jgi:hypothetical protein
MMKRRRSPRTRGAAYVETAIVVAGVITAGAAAFHLTSNATQDTSGREATCIRSGFLDCRPGLATPFAPQQPLVPPLAPPLVGAPAPFSLSPSTGFGPLPAKDEKKDGEQKGRNSRCGGDSECASGHCSAEHNVCNELCDSPTGGKTDPGYCSCDEWGSLNAAVNDACHTPGCLGTDTCATLAAKEASQRACLAARSNREGKCYAGGNPGHQRQMSEVANAIGKCEHFKAKACGAPQPTMEKDQWWVIDP